MKVRSSQPKLNRQILEEASSWFVDFRVGDADAATRARVDEWLRQSPEHIRAYMEIARIYVELPALKLDRNFDLEALAAGARSDGNVLQLRESAPAPAARGRASVWRWGVAASLLFAALGLGALAWRDVYRYPTYSTGIGENRSIALDDGSIIDLTARSMLRIRFSKAERQVELLDGQALFEVAHDPARPFIVRSDGAVVRAVGTQFDVYRLSGRTRVTVVEGRVAVADIARGRDESGSIPGATYVSSGEQVTVTAQTITKPKPANVAAATAWIRHRFIFNATPLAEVVDLFNRYNVRQLMIDDRELARFHVSGVYASTDPASLIRFLREQPGVDVTETGDAIHIHRK